MLSIQASHGRLYYTILYIENCAVYQNFQTILHFYIFPPLLWLCHIAIYSIYIHIYINIHLSSTFNVPITIFSTVLKSPYEFHLKIKFSNVVIFCIKYKIHIIYHSYCATANRNCHSTERPYKESRKNG